MAWKCPTDTLKPPQTPEQSMGLGQLRTPKAAPHTLELHSRAAFRSHPPEHPLILLLLTASTLPLGPAPHGHPAAESGATPAPHGGPQLTPAPPAQSTSRGRSPGWV